MKRRAERTYFNTEYMPELYEDAIESNDPQEAERNTHGHMDDVLYDDRMATTVRLSRTNHDVSTQTSNL